MRRALSAAPELITGPPEAAELLTQTEKQAAEALADLRELARGICPPRLADLGLPAALEAQARKATLPVAIAAEGIGQVPAANRDGHLLLHPGSAAERCGIRRRSLKDSPPHQASRPGLPTQEASWHTRARPPRTP
jgi:hypothetical protein